MRDLPIRINIMPPCLCESKVIGYEYSEDGFNVTHCACGGVISCAESEDVEEIAASEVERVMSEVMG